MSADTSTSTGAGAVYIRKKFKPAPAVSGVYRGPDRRRGGDRRSGEQLPHASALNAGGAKLEEMDAGAEQLIEAALKDGRLLPVQKQWAQELGKADIAALKGYLVGARPIDADRRSGIERRNKLSGDVWAVGGRMVGVHSALAHEVGPLLALCEFALLAHQSLSAMGRAAAEDAPLMERLEGIDPGWTALLESEGGAVQHIGQCLLMVRGLVQRKADAAQEASEQALALSLEIGGHHA